MGEWFSGSPLAGGQSCRRRHRNTDTQEESASEMLVHSTIAFRWCM